LCFITERELSSTARALHDHLVAAGRPVPEPRRDRRPHGHRASARWRRPDRAPGSGFGGPFRRGPRFVEWLASQDTAIAP
jgi:hypothetical protein